MQLKLAEHLEDFFYFISYRWARLKCTIKGFFCAHQISALASPPWGHEGKYYYPRCIRCGRGIKLKVVEND